jgi:hypothetical protein
MRSWLIPNVDLTATRTKFNFDDAATLLLDALLFSEPALVGNPLGEKGVLQLTL